MLDPAGFSRLTIPSLTSDALVNEGVSVGPNTLHSHVSNLPHVSPSYTTVMPAPASSRPIQSPRPPRSLQSTQSTQSSQSLKTMQSMQSMQSMQPAQSLKSEVVNCGSGQSLPFHSPNAPGPLNGLGDLGLHRQTSLPYTYSKPYSSYQQSSLSSKPSFHHHRDSDFSLKSSSSSLCSESPYGCDHEFHPPDRPLPSIPPLSVKPVESLQSSLLKQSPLSTSPLDSIQPVEFGESILSTQSAQSGPHNIPISMDFSTPVQSKKSRDFASSPLHSSTFRSLRRFVFDGFPAIMPISDIVDFLYPITIQSAEYARNAHH